MAIRITSSPRIMINQSIPFKKDVFGMAMLRRGQPSHQKSLSLQNCRSSPRGGDQVFEDHSKGIICYRDDRGEIICEGFDEGPRLHQQRSSPTSYHARDAGMILELLQQKWVEITESGIVDGNAMLKDSNCNGYNTLREIRCLGTLKIVYAAGSSYSILLWQSANLYIIIFDCWLLSCSKLTRLTRSYIKSETGWHDTTALDLRTRNIDTI